MNRSQIRRGLPGLFRNPQLQPLESRVVLAASLGWDGPGQGSANLTYYVANHPSTLTQAQTDQAIETALAAWSNVADLTFTRTNTPGLANSLDFSFSNIDGAAGTLAQAYFPADVNSSRIAGDVQFDSSEVWEVGNALGSRAFDLVYVAVHEIGHSLGLDHTSVVGSVLAPYASAQSMFTALSSVDIASILELYAPASSSNFTNTGSTSGTSTDTGTTTSTTTTSTDTTDTGDSDSNPFPRNRWRRGGAWHRFGGRLDVDGSVLHNVYLPNDVNGDWRISPADALNVINVLNSGIDTSSIDSATSGLCDTNGDGQVSPADALIVINTLNSGTVNAYYVSIDNSSTATDTSPGSTNTTPADTTTDTTIDTTNSGSTDSDSDDDLPSTTDETDETECRHNSSLVLAWLSSDKVITAYDTDISGTLTQSEVPAAMWELLSNSSADADSDGSITVDELQAAITAARQDIFNSKDTNADGSIDATEAGTLAWSRLSAADTDGSENVSFDEFNTWVTDQVAQANLPLPGVGHFGHHGRGEFNGAARSPELWQLAADLMVSKFDSNADGQLSQTELPTNLYDLLTSQNADINADGEFALDELAAAVASARQTYFQTTDANADGELSRDEVGLRTWRRIRSADTDSTGTISSDEFLAWTPTETALHSKNRLVSTTASGSSTGVAGMIRQVVSRLRHR